MDTQEADALVLADEYRKLKEENVRLRLIADASRKRCNEILNSRTWKTAVVTRNFLVAIITRALRSHYRKHSGQYPVISEIFKLPTTALTVPTSLFTCNPSIVSTEDGWLATVRAHNYIIGENGLSSILRGTELQNENWLVWLDHDLCVTQRKKISVGHADIAISMDEDCGLARNGFEDLRLIKANGSIYAIAATANTVLGSSTMAIGQLIDDRLVNVDFMLSPRNSLKEKNWMPVVINDELFAVYKISPFCLLKIQKNPKIIFERSCDAFLKDYNGSSQLIRFGENWLCIVHRRVRVRSGIFYLHKFVLLDPEWNIAAQSHDFFFEHRGIEFCAGLAGKGDRFVISYGVNDGSAKLLELNKSHIERLLYSNNIH